MWSLLLEPCHMAYRNFETLLRDDQMSFQDFVIKFESMHSNIKKYKMDLPDGVLAYRFLHSANLSEEKMQLCRATIKEFSYAEMKAKVLSLFGDKIQSGMQSLNLKEEPVFYGQNSQNDRNWGSKRFDGNRRGPNKHRRGRGGDQSARGGRGYVTPQKPQNRRGADGKVTQCAVCSSRYHWAKDCPEIPHDGQNAVAFTEDDGYDRYDGDDGPEDDSRITLFQKCDNDDTLKWFLGESIGCAIVDSGCSKNVAGTSWVQCFLETLDEHERKLITKQKSDSRFKFGKGSAIQSSEKIKIPVTLGNQKVFIETDVVDADIPLLLSKEALKSANTVLDFCNDRAIMFGQEQALIETSSGHYAIPLCVAVDDRCAEEQVVLISNVMIMYIDHVMSVFVIFQYTFSGWLALVSMFK